MQGRDVFVVRAGNSAGQAPPVPRPVRPAADDAGTRDSLARSMSDYLVREIEVIPNIRVRLHTEVINGHGSTHLDTSPCTTASTTRSSRSRRPRCSC
jgi:thioredoxin reductase (NADPH)